MIHELDHTEGGPAAGRGAPHHDRGVLAALSDDVTQRIESILDLMARATGMMTTLQEATP